MSSRCLVRISSVVSDIYVIAYDPLDESSFMHIRITSLLPTSAHLEHSLPYVQTWVSACELNHPKCGASYSYTPPRLLDVDSSDPAFVKLLMLSSAKTNRYACLSHCWGSTRSKYMVYKTNLSTNMVGIPVSELPKTFSDAIDISRALGIQYLWIDSLCIIQDSQADWADHVEIMVSIYENSYITLAAGASSDDDGGFFSVPSESYTRPQCSKLQLGGKICNVMCVIVLTILMPSFQLKKFCLL